MEKHKHGGDIYSQPIRMDYSVNISPLGLPGGVKEALKSSLDALVNYPDVECRKLRERLGEREQLPMEDILCGNGAAELIFALAHGRKPRKALLAAPGFAEYENALQSVGCQIEYYDLKKENGFQLGEDFTDYITKDTDILFLCNPNNPTGLTVSGEFLVKIGEKCESTGTILVVDECFNEFLDDPEKNTMKPYLKTFRNLVILKAFTKIYAMPGLRLGYCLSENRELLDIMRDAMQPWSVSVMAQAGGIAAMDDELYVDEVRNLIHRERGFLLYNLRKMGFHPLEARANFIFFEGPWGLDEALLEEGVLIRNCENYRGLGKGYFRIAVKGHQENECLVELMKNCLNRMPEQKQP